MSYFPGLFMPPASGFNSYLLQIGSHGVVTIYRLDENGKPVDMCSGNAKDALGEPLKKISGGYRIRHYGPQERPYRSGTVFPFDWGLNRCGSTWASAAKALNGKGKNAGELQYVVEQLDRMDLALPYIQWNKDESRWEVTEEGKSMDAKIRAD